MAQNILFFKLATGGRTRAQILTKIAQIDAIIDSLLTTSALIGSGNAHIVQYEINTGQTTQRVQYSTVKSVTEAVQGYEAMRIYYENKLTPRVVRLMDQSNFRGR
jgi:hypothetical protein